MGKLLVILGIFLVLAGLLITFRDSIPFLGKLPGDIYIAGDNYQFYFPLFACVVLSIFITIILYLIKK